MRRDVLLLLCSICLFPALVQADDDGMSAKDIKTLFLVMTTVNPSAIPQTIPGMLSGSWKPPAVISVPPR